MLTVVYAVVGIWFLWNYCRDGKHPKNWHGLVAFTVFCPLMLVWLVFECMKWAWSRFWPWLNREI